MGKCQKIYFENGKPVDATGRIYFVKTYFLPKHGLFYRKFEIS